MSARKADYQLRIAERGATSVTDATTDLVLGVDRLSTIPVVGGQTVHPTQGRTESNPWQVRVVDKDGILSALISDNGRAAILGRLAELRKRDRPSGEPAFGDWVALDGGRISHVSEPEGPGLVAVQVTDERQVERAGDIFATTSDVQVFPLGPTVEFMRWDPAGYATVRVAAVAGEFVSFRTGVRLPQEVFDRMRSDIRREASGLNPPAGGNFETLRLELEVTQGSVAVHNVGQSRTAHPAAAVGQLGENLNFTWVNLGAGHGFVVNQEVGIRVFFEETETGTAFPRLVGGRDGVHLGQLWKDVADGVHGGPPVRYNPAAVAALVAADLPRVWLRMTEKVNRARFLEDSVNALAGIVPLRDGEGRLVPDLFWQRRDIDPDLLPELDPSSAADWTWEHLGREVVNVIRFSFQRVAADRAAGTLGIPPADFRDVPEALDGLLAFEHTQSVEHDTVELMGPHEHRVTTQCILSTSAERAQLQFLARELFDVFGDGPFRRRLTAPASFGLAPADMLRLKLGDMRSVNWTTGDRTGSVLARVLERRIHPAHHELVILDNGPLLQPLDAPSVSIVQDAEDPDLVVVTVSDLPAGARATVEVAWREDDTTPAENEWEMPQANQENGTLSFRLARSGGFAHASAFSTAPNRLRSARVFASVALSVRPIVEEVTVGLEGPDWTPIVSLTANDDTEGIRLRYSVHADEDTPEFGDPSDHPVADFPLELEGVTVPAGQRITVETEPWTGFTP